MRRRRKDLSPLALLLRAGRPVGRGSCRASPIKIGPVQPPHTMQPRSTMNNMNMDMNASASSWMLREHHVRHHLLSDQECNVGNQKPGEPCWCYLLRSAEKEGASTNTSWAAVARGTCGAPPAANASLEAQSKHDGCWHAIGHGLFLARLASESYSLDPGAGDLTRLPLDWSSPACEHAVSSFLHSDEDYDPTHLRRAEAVCMLAGTPRATFFCVTGAFHVYFNSMSMGLPGVGVDVCDESSAPLPCFGQAAATGSTYSGLTARGCGGRPAPTLLCDERPVRVQRACRLAAALGCAQQGGELSNSSMCANDFPQLSETCAHGQLFIAYAFEYMGGASSAGLMAATCAKIEARMERQGADFAVATAAVRDVCSAPRLEWFVDLEAPVAAVHSSGIPLLRVAIETGPYWVHFALLCGVMGAMWGAWVFTRHARRQSDRRLQSYWQALQADKKRADARAAAADVKPVDSCAD